MHVLDIDDARHADFVGVHASDCFHTRTHLRQQIAPRLFVLSIFDFNF